MHVLLTNDDGIDAPWLSALAGAFGEHGHDTTVLAPGQDESGTSGALHPVPIGGQVDVTLQEAPQIPADRAWGVRGASPSVCVLIGLAGTFVPPVDLVISGPNYGWNVGRDIWRSGTVWAAITAWGMDVPALAVSGAPTPHDAEDLRALVTCAVNVAKDLLAEPRVAVWNLNLPAPPSSAWPEPRWTTSAAGERLAASRVEIVGDVPSGLTVRIAQPPDVRVPRTPHSDAQCVAAGGIALGRVRPPTATP